MKKKKITLDREIVKYIFPATEPAILQGEDGYIVYNFIRLYPNKLAVFVPMEVTQSNYSSAFPKSFESYFADIYEETEYLSRLLEVKLVPNIRNIGVECVSGKVLRRDENNYTVFRFDELLDPRDKTDLLCRVKIGSLTTDDRIDILSTNPEFREDAMAADGIQYMYWTMPLSRLFRVDDEVLAAIFAFANSVRFRNGPF
ncbi:hypothetical protein IJG92_01800 [Candidatus Saccharibacteria bacterium]|nr:hypothetical protein [Candidatus Saccharibacteria bacterium]